MLLDASGRFANSGLGLVVAPAFAVHTADAYICTAFALVDSGWSNFASFCRDPVALSLIRSRLPRSSPRTPLNSNPRRQTSLLLLVLFDCLLRYTSLRCGQSVVSFESPLVRQSLDWHANVPRLNLGHLRQIKCQPLTEPDPSSERTARSLLYQKEMDTSQVSFRSIFGGTAEPADDVDAEPDTTQHGPHSFNNVTTTPAKLADESVAPFLAKHIPEQYAPLGSRTGKPADMSIANSKFCYRHRPDLKCRRQADEPSMDKLQRVCSFWCCLCTMRLVCML